jgi:hypothetical protein
MHAAHERSAGTDDRRPPRVARIADHLVRHRSRLHRLSRLIDAYSPPERRRVARIER